MVLKVASLFFLLILVIGISGAEKTDADGLYAAGMKAYAEHNDTTALALFNQSVASRDNDPDTVRNARHRIKEISWIQSEMALNRTEAADLLTERLQFSPEEISRLLEKDQSIQIESDGEPRYFTSIVNNVVYHNKTLIQKNSCSQNHSAFVDELYPLIASNHSYAGGYGDPHTFTVTSSLALPRDELPENGTLKVWMPLPVSTESQKNISIITLQPEQYIRSGPVTTGDLGQVYFEIPLTEMTGPFVNLTASYNFTTSERKFSIDPEKIEPYNTSSPLYQRYTASQPNIELTPEISALADSIVSGEQNPFRKAKLIYEYIIGHYPYSSVPHMYLAATATPESTYMLKTGFGDCGTQSMLFAALCRAAGVPARSSGGYQLVPGLAGPHFWAEFYLPGYGWIPVDVTMAETADWACNRTDAERAQFKEYFFANMDPYRYTIQNDADIPFSPDPGEESIMSMVHQTPTVVCTESDQDMELLGMLHWNIIIGEEGSPERASMAD